MSGKREGWFERHRTVIMYLLWGSLTTLVGGGVYYAVLLGGRVLFDIPSTEVTGARYMALYTAAQLLQWLLAALFAFYTNRRWVFTEADKTRPILKQLIPFFGGRVMTLGLDYVITFGMTMLLVVLFPSWHDVPLWGETWNLCEILSKLLAAVVVIVTNYFISKIFVFKGKKERSGN